MVLAAISQFATTHASKPPNRDIVRIDTSRESSLLQKLKLSGLESVRRSRLVAISILEWHVVPSLPRTSLDAHSVHLLLSIFHHVQHGQALIRSSSMNIRRRCLLLDNLLWPVLKARMLELVQRAAGKLYHCPWRPPVVHVRWCAPFWS